MLKETLKFTAEVPTIIDPKALWFVFCNDLIFLVNENDQLRFPTPKDLLKTIDTTDSYFLGTFEGAACYATEVTKEIMEQYKDNFYPLRLIHDKVGLNNFELACKAKHLLRWYRHTQFCGRCGSKTIDSNKERAKECPTCEIAIYPELSPAIIVLVKRNHELLLARPPHFKEGMYSVLSGFVEPGESVEETVVREVHEEVGVFVHNIRYTYSQAWPFPNSLMLGFTADYHSGEIKVDEKEIEDAQWFTKDNLPLLPNPSSISRMLIEDFLKKS